ncbi:MAG: nucleoside-diphosphate sugar epimerase/dehydratase, partial [Micrococcales bacterium]|nr:nucleoside-diphosphate sugar epimerase/dehydratase [Micrococcales bacterium]
GGALALIGMLALRFAVRSAASRRERARDSQHRALVFGAGDAGRRLVRSALREHDADLLPVGLLDDDSAKARLRIDGVPVRGGAADLTRVAQATDATMLIIAAPHADPAVKRALTEAAAQAGLEVKILPSLTAIMDASNMVQSLRDIDVADLLGRSPVHLDDDVVAAQIRGKRVLVTGAGGSIGSELCRQIRRHEPASLVLLDRDESGLQATQLSLTGRGLLDTDETVLADIRDAEGILRAFRATRPEVVLHAAALKHQPILERFPSEAWKTNVLGTYNVLRAAADVDVQIFVNISTDKAADPSCVLGYSKRVTERLTADFARNVAGRYVSVRFGNVLGSRGSVIHAFTAQIERGGPLTVTDPQVSRYFMLIPEACQLVLEAACVGGNGQVMVLEMGEPVKILDVAQTLLRMSGRRDVEIVYTGLREGEKLHEDLFSPGEHPQPTAHPLVFRVSVPPFTAADVLDVDPTSAAQTEHWMLAASRGSASTMTAGGTP